MSDYVRPCDPCARGAHDVCTRGLVKSLGDPLCSCWCMGMKWEGLPPPEHEPPWQPPPKPAEPCHGCARKPGKRRVAHARWCERGARDSCEHLAEKSTPPLSTRRETAEERRHGPGKSNPRKRRS